MTRPRLVYFDMRGRAEPIRLMLHVMGTGFEDHRVVSREEWSQLKPRLPGGAGRRRMEGLPAIVRYIDSGDRPAVFGMGIRGAKIDPRRLPHDGSAFQNPWTKPIPLK